MRNILFAVLFCLFANSTSLCNAQTLIHYWHFNNYAATSTYTPNITAIAADYSDLPASNARILYAEQAGVSSAYSTYIEGFVSSVTDYDTVNLRMSQAAGNYIRVHNPSDSMELLFYTPSTGFNNLVLTFGTSRPVNGMIHQNYDYSVDSGANWISSGLSLLTDSVLSTFQRITLTCTNAAVNNNPKLVFRITWTGNITGTSGNNRFDNVSLDGDTISGPSSVNQISAEAALYTLYPNPVINTLSITSTTEGPKHIHITNIIGQKMFESAAEGKVFHINTCNFPAGYYYISIGEESAGKTSMLKFLKN